MGSSSSAHPPAGSTSSPQQTNFQTKSTTNKTKEIYNKNTEQNKNDRNATELKQEKQSKSKGVKENSAGFPTPMLLAAAQCKYASDHRGMKPKLDKDGIPLPFPPPTMKAEVFNPASFKNIDRHAQKAPLDLAAKGYPELIAYLIKPAQNDVGKVRAFFVWIASQRLQQVLDYVGSNVPSTDKPLFLVVLTLVRQWGNGYSELFDSLCKEARIPCRVVKGRVKGSGYRLGEKTRGTNDYCMVFVDGAWRFVDQHWGSQFVMGGVDNDEWELVHDTDKEGNNTNPQGDGWDYICDDFYFLTDPEALVYTHLAIEPECQLLARPVTEEEYWKMAHLKDAFFELEMTTISQPKCLLETDDGIVVFEFGLNMKRHCSFSYAMYKSLNDPSLNLIDGVSIEQYVMMETIANTLRITINFPCIGRFKFNLYGRDLDSKVGFTAVCEYAITCNKPNFKSEPNPENTRGEWGPGAEVTVLNIDPLNNDGGIIYAKDGRAEVRWRMNADQQLRFQNRLKNPSEPKENLNSCIRHYKTEKDVVFLMKLPHKGRYVLQLFVNDVTKDKNFTSVCNYIVISDVGCSDPAPYPPCDNKLSQTGDVTTERGELRLVPVSHKESIIDPYNKGDLTIQMSSTQEGGDLHAQLQKYYENDVEGKTVEDCSDYVLLHQNQRNVDITAQFPQVGFYKLDVLSRNRPVYQYLINVQTPDVKATPYPELGPAWRADCQIMEPRNGLLQTGQKVHIAVHVPGATQVKAVGQTTTTNLTCKKKGSDIWEGAVTTEARDGMLKIVSDAAGAGKPNQLFIYKVLSKDGAKEVSQRQEAALHEAEQYKRGVEQQKLIKANDAKKKQKEAQDKARLAEEDFNKNESKYRSREALIISREKEEELKDAGMHETNEEEEKKLANRADQKADLLAMLQKRDKQPTPKLLKTGKEKISDERYRREDKYLQPVTGRSQGGGSPQYQEYLNEDDAANHKPLYKVDGSDGWKKYHPQLSQKMALERLRESIRGRNVTALRNSIKDCQDYGMQDHKEVKSASNIVTVFDARRKLDEAYENRDQEALHSQIEYIKQSGLAKHMPNEVREASYRLETLERTNHLHEGIMDMDKKTMTEVRRYQNPPPMLHKVMQGTFLLLGEDEESTETWKDCQRLLNPQGSAGLNRKMMEFDTRNINPEMVARSKEILTDVDISKVRAVCPAAGTFYVWAMGVIEECEVTGNNKNGQFDPATRDRQKEILGRQAPHEQRRDRSYYKSLAMPQGSGGDKHPYRSPRDGGGGEMSYR